MKNFRPSILLGAIFTLLLSFGAVAAPQPKVVISQEVITPAASTALTVPEGSDLIIITVRTAGVHIDFGGNPATVDDPYFPPGRYEWDQQRGLVSSMRFITSTDGTAVVSATYLRTQG